VTRRRRRRASPTQEHLFDYPSADDTVVVDPEDHMTDYELERSVRQMTLEASSGVYAQRRRE